MTDSATINCTKVIGIVADIRRDSENDYGSEKCNVFGLVEEEYDALTKIAVVTPKRYSFEKCDRITVSCRLIYLILILSLFSKTSFKFWILRGSEADLWEGGKPQSWKGAKPQSWERGKPQS